MIFIQDELAKIETINDEYVLHFAHGAKISFPQTKPDNIAWQFSSNVDAGKSGISCDFTEGKKYRFLVESF